MPRRVPRARRGAGQSLTELALITPVLLVMLGGALDLGRLFYAHVAIENAAKEGALYGASNPRCTAPKEACADPNTVSWHVETEANGIPGLTYSAVCLEPDGDVIDVEECEPGDHFRVHVESDFVLVTPILVPLLGDALDLESTAVSTVSVGAFDPDATPIPIATPTPSPTPTPTNTPEPETECTVPDFENVRKNDAAAVWEAAGFTGAITFGAGSGNYKIHFQSLPAGTSQPCSSGITLGP